MTPTAIRARLAAACPKGEAPFVTYDMLLSMATAMVGEMQRIRDTPETDEFTTLNVLCKKFGCSRWTMADICASEKVRKVCARAGARTRYNVRDVTELMYEARNTAPSV